MTIVINTRSFSVLDAAFAKFNNKTISNKTLKKVEVIANRLFGISNTPMNRSVANKYAVRSMVGGGEVRFDGLIRGIRDIRKAKIVIENNRTLKFEGKKAFFDKLDKLEENAIAQAKYFLDELEQPEAPYFRWPREYVETMLYGWETGLRKPALNKPSGSNESEA
jgi:hypothetical protein